MKNWKDWYIGILALLIWVVLAPASAQDAPADKRVREYLEQYRYEDLLVEDTNQEQDRWTARVKDAAGKRHTVHIGSHLGRNDGRIVAIDAEGIRVVERVPDNLGRSREQEVFIRKGVPYEDPRVVLRRMHTAPVKATPVQSEFVAAARGGHTDRLADLLKRGADLNAAAGAGKDTALTAAVRKNQIDTVTWLIRNGAKVDSFVGSEEDTPLTLSASQGNAAITKLLLEAGADPNLSNLSEFTPLYYASVDGHLQIANLLLARRANPTLSAKIGASAVTQAAAQGHLAIVKRFLEAGVGLETRDRGGHTMLAAACSQGYTEVVTFLVEAGADVNATNSSGETVLDLAICCGGDEIVELLRSKGARCKDNVCRKP